MSSVTNDTTVTRQALPLTFTQSQEFVARFLREGIWCVLGVFLGVPFSCQQSSRCLRLVTQYLGRHCGCDGSRILDHERLYAGEEWCVQCVMVDQWRGVKACVQVSKLEEVVAFPPHCTHVPRPGISLE